MLVKLTLPCFELRIYLHVHKNIFHFNSLLLFFAHGNNMISTELH